MNEIVNNFLLLGDKFILYSACRPFIKTKEKNLKF